MMNFKPYLDQLKIMLDELSIQDYFASSEKPREKQIDDLPNPLSQALKKTEKNLPNMRYPIVFASIALLVFFGGFTLWSCLVPLETAAVASGKIIVDTRPKNVQHLEGGIVKKFFVKEGSRVKQGDPLIELDATQSRAKFKLLKNQAYRLLASEARLIAARDDAKQITWPSSLLSLSQDAAVRRNMKMQQALFTSNQETLNKTLAILKQRVTQIHRQIEAYNAQVTSETVQSKFIQEEIVAYEYLDKRHLIDKPRLLAVKREAARLNGNRGEHLGLIAQSEEKIGETEEQIIATKEQYLQKTLDDLDKVQKELTDVLQQKIAAEDVFRRTLIVAPVSGIVANLSIHQVGAVITPGQSFMTIVPDQDKLIVEAEISPLDIDIVHPGLSAKVRLIAYKQRTLPPLEGVVSLVSPDSVFNDKTQTAYFSARIVISGKALAHYPRVKLYPGMPVQVMIIVEKRSAFEYFMQPIKDSFTKAFREE